MNLREQLLSVAGAYCAARDISLARVSTLIFNDGKRLHAIQRGGDLGTSQFERALLWFSQHWPDELALWPPAVARPARLPAGAEP